MKKLTNLDKKMDSMLNESVNKTTNPLNEGWFDIISQGALIISVILWAFESRGGEISISGFKRAWSDIKNQWKNRHVDPELKAIIMKLAKDNDVLKAAKEKVVGPRGGTRPQYESDIQFREFLKKKLSATEYALLKKYTESNRWTKDAKIKANAGDYFKQAGFNQAKKKFENRE